LIDEGLAEDFRAAAERPLALCVVVLFFAAFFFAVFATFFFACFAGALPSTSSACA
jgi:hypothetical protein